MALKHFYTKNKRADWGGTIITHYTNGNFLTVKKLLDHKRIEPTMKFIGLFHFKDDEFEVTTATTVE